MRAVHVKQGAKMVFGGSGSRDLPVNDDFESDDEGSGRVFGGIAGLEGRLARERPLGYWENVGEDEDEDSWSVDTVMRHVCEPQTADSLQDATPLEIGAQGECAARAYLAHEGFEILETNWTCPAGEADIIALDGSDCVFVEVKTRLETTPRQTMPELAVGREKQRRYQRIASYYVEEHPVRSVRYDVVAVSIIGDDMAKLHHYKAAFGSEW